MVEGAFNPTQVRASPIVVFCYFLLLHVLNVRNFEVHPVILLVRGSGGSPVQGQKKTSP